MDKRLACFPAEKHLIKTGSFAGFLENIQSVFIKNRRSIGRFGQERNGSISFDLAKEWRTVFAKTKYLGIGDMSGCFFFQIKKDPDKTTADGRPCDISSFQKIRKLGKTFILVPVF